MCTREPVWRASITSRATMTSSAMPGQPGSPSRPEISPSWQQAVGPASVGSWACWETTPPNALTYSSARRITRASCTHLPSSEKTRTRARDRAISPSSASSSPAQSLGDGTDGLYVDQAGLATEVEDPQGGLGGVGHRRRVGHRQHRGEAAHRGGPRAGQDRLGVLAAGLAQVRVQVDEPGQRDEAVGVEHVGTGGRLGHEQAGVVDVQVLRLLPQHRGAGDDQAHQDSSPASRW